MSFLLTTNRKSPVGFQNMRSDLKFAPCPSGEMGMTSLPVIEKRPITPKPLQIGISLLLTTNSVQRHLQIMNNNRINSVHCYMHN